MDPAVDLYPCHQYLTHRQEGVDHYREEGETRGEDKDEEGAGVEEMKAIAIEKTGEESEDEMGIRKPRVGRIPEAPTKRELVSTCPSTCHTKHGARYVLHAKEFTIKLGRQDQRRRRVYGVTISLDYYFLTSEGEAEEDPKVLTMHDDRLEALWALGVQQKGVTPDTVTWITQKLEEAGYKGM